MFLFFNQKSSYEMRISDWSSDVCSSDLLDLAALHDLEQVFGADNIGSGGLRLFSLVAAREHADAHRLAGALGQGHDAANHLIGVTRIDAKVDRNLHGLVELRRDRKSTRLKSSH